MPTLTERAKTLEVKRGELNQIFESHKTDQKDERGNPVFDEKIPLDEIKKRNDELGTLQQEYDAAKMVDETYIKNAAEIKSQQSGNRMFGFSDGNRDNARADETKSIKAMPGLFTSSPAYKNRDAGRAFSVEMDVSMKTLVTEAAGYLPYPAQQPYVIFSAQRRLVVADLIPQDDTDAAIIIYMEETTFTNNSAAVAEGGSKPESALAYTRRSVPMTKIATTLPVTDEQLSDVPQLEAVLRNRLTFQVQLEEERELLNGNPGGSNAAEMTGFLNKSGILTQALGADDRFTAAYKAVTQVNSVTGFADASGFVYNPLDWQTIRLTKDTTGRFILGNPDQPGPDMLWGLPVVKTIAMSQGTSLTGDFRTYSHIDRKWGLRVDVGYVNDDFRRNQVTLRAEERLALEIYRASAFCQQTGL